ncbi:MAG: hypothetical protein IKG81_10740 [Bacteroidales bacterium]|nr:hypothetical protein [Bacteroidales bacterium]
MTNKLKVFAMLLCVALVGIFSSCTKEDGGYSIPSNDNEIYNLLIGKWSVQMDEITGTGDLHWKGTLEFKDSGELIGSGVWHRDLHHDPYGASYVRYVDKSWSGEGSFALYKHHLDMLIPNYLILESIGGTDGDSEYPNGEINYGSTFDYSSTIISITESNMVIWATGNSTILGGAITYKMLCDKIE